MEYLEFDDFILINHLTIERHGGYFNPPKNLKNPESLKYLVEAVEGQVFGRELYPEIHDKAGFYLFSVNSNHVFQDGNKRTGLEAALLFLKLNGYRLKDELVRVKLEAKGIPEKGDSSNEILFNFVIETASSKLSLEECGYWFKANIEVVRR